MAEIVYNLDTKQYGPVTPALRAKMAAANKRPPAAHPAPLVSAPDAAPADPVEAWMNSAAFDIGGFGAVKKKYLVMVAAFTLAAIGLSGGRR